MPKGNSFDDVQADGDTLLLVWDDNQELTLGDVTREGFMTIMTTFRTSRANLEQLRSQITAAISNVNDQAKAIKDIRVRGHELRHSAFIVPNSSLRFRAAASTPSLGGTKAADFRNAVSACGATSAADSCGTIA